MALNPDYVPLTPLWEVFTDKDLLTFLRDGYAKFYRDTARTVGKPVYQLTGSPPNYTYTQYGFLDTDGSWRVNMNDQGAFSEVLYGYPLDMDGNVDLYFADFFSSTGVFQFSREGFPNFFVPGGNNTTPIFINYIPNGQFRLHTDVPPTDTTILGQITQPVTQVAFGGWTYERPVGSTARDFVTFQRIGSYVTNPDKSPRYTIRVSCQSPSVGDTFKDLRVKFDDVNKFSSDDDILTFAITAKSDGGGSVPVDLILIKNFGTGGDPTTETNLTTFTITPTFAINYFAFDFGANTGDLIGQLNDDFVQLALRFPTNGLFDIELTDGILTPGDITLPAFNDTTTRQFMYQSLFDDFPTTTDGSDIGLPLVLTKTGLRFDDSTVALVYPSGSFSVPFGFLDADGSMYEAALHSADGIPYSRLQSKITLELMTPLVPINYNIPVFGTGTSFLTASILTSLDLRINTNKAGATAIPSDGANPTGFTFRSNHIGQTDIPATAYVTSNGFYIISNSVGIVTFPPIGTVPTSAVNQLVNGENARSVIEIVGIATGAGGQYFIFYTPGAAVLVWFKIDGVGTIPVVPHDFAIEIDLYTTITSQDESSIVSSCISGFQSTQITTKPGSAITPGSYFNIATTIQTYYVWYKVNGVGVDPAPLGQIGIEVDVLSTDTKDQVTGKTATAINSKYFATPDLRGLFIKGYDGGRGLDLGSQLRYAQNSVTFGDVIGSREFSDNISHDHRFYTAGITSGSYWIFKPTPDPDDTPEDSATGAPLGNTPSSPTVYANDMTFNGSTESRPENIYLHYIIKY